MVDEFKEFCPAKTNLLSEWQSATEAYSKAVAELSRQIGVVSRTEYEKLSLLAENAHKRALEAKANLNAHSNDHGCDGGEAVA